MPKLIKYSILSKIFKHTHISLLAGSALSFVRYAWTLIFNVSRLPAPLPPTISKLCIKTVIGIFRTSTKVTTHYTKIRRALRAKNIRVYSRQILRRVSRGVFLIQILSSPLMLNHLQQTYFCQPGIKWIYWKVSLKGKVGRQWLERHIVFTD